MDPAPADNTASAAPVNPVPVSMVVAVVAAVGHMVLAPWANSARVVRVNLVPVVLVAHKADPVAPAANVVPADPVALKVVLRPLRLRHPPHRLPPKHKVVVFRGACWRALGVR